MVCSPTICIYLQVNNVPIINDSNRREENKNKQTLSKERIIWSCCSPWRRWWRRESSFVARSVAPLLDDRLRDLPGVLPRPGADLLRDVYAVLRRLQQGDQLGHELAFHLWLQGAGLLRDFLDNLIMCTVVDVIQLFWMKSGKSSIFLLFDLFSCDI